MKYLIAVLFLCQVAYVAARMPQTLNKEKDEKWYLHKPIAPEKPKVERAPQKIKRRGLTYLSESKNKTFTEMNFEELKVAKDVQINKENFTIATRYLERLIVLCDVYGSIDQKANLLLELADTYFKMAKYDDAQKEYWQFVELYPGNKQVEHAFYRAIVCLSNGILTPDRDQTKTEQAIEKADQFLERADVFTTYADKVRDIRLSACKTLVANQFDICHTNLKLGNYEGAQKRLELVRNQWISQVPEAEITLAQLEVQLGHEFEQFKPSERSFEIANLAQEAKPKKVDMVARF